MSKRTFLIITIITFVVLFFTGCVKDDGSKTYITLMSVPMEATVPNGLHLDCILSITNADPNAPETPMTAQFAIFGFTNTQGEVEYYAYGEKKSVLNDQTHLQEEGFYPINFVKDGQNISVSLKEGNSPLAKVNPGTGTPENYQGELPFSFYTPTGQTGMYTFTDASGNIVYRVYAAFSGGTGNFFPANADGTMVSGSLPINKTTETTLQSQGFDAVTNLLTTPISCKEIQFIYAV
ncbi:hypothetical protein GH810_08595 [Acetobacterium paludosum]|uniref:Lipoprotein n=1 Tax=Acetobacterium paludosum TaxID=52693 RepID=A0A923KSH1_9FIRM|nr:hypothetical protein [Acetobacterium paludosum]MBC3888367.1 hypothetical protein [Acetobacterium paludosum]